MEPLISVIVPVYRVEAYLRKCVDSIRSQTYRKLEIILVDDGSPDNCPAICDEVASADERIKVIHQKNGGLSAARNAGLEIATGEYIAFVDSDDYIHPEMYSIMHSAIQKNNAQLAICAATFIDEYDNNLSSFELADEVINDAEGLRYLQTDNEFYYIVAWNKLYHRDIFRNIRYPVGKNNEDNAVAHLILAEAKRAVTVSDKLYYYLQRPNSIMHSVSVKSLNDVEMFYRRVQFFEQKGYSIYIPSACKKLLEKYCRFRYSVHPKSMEEFIYLKEIDKLAYKVYQHPSIKKTRRDSLRYSYPELFVALRRIKGYLLWARLMLKAAGLHFAPTQTRHLLVNTPTHGNLGDHAIAIAQRQFISDKMKTGTIFELTAKDFDHYGKAFAKAVPADAQILIHGGGYLGTLWPVEEFRFRNILQLFHRQRVIVFPQTVTFNLETESGRRFFEESKTIYESHPDLTIFVREKNSYAFMREHMPSIRCILVPDIVTTMRLNVSEADRNGVLLCLRHDVEKVLSEEAVLEIQKCIQETLPEQEMEFTDTVLEHRIFPDVRESEVRTKLSQFAGAKLIVTDRLHGMIFAALVGTPCVAFSNSNGKVRLVYEWIKDLPYIQFVNSVEELPEVLKKIDLSREYQYNYKLVEEHFRPLAEALKEK